MNDLREKCVRSYLLRTHHETARLVQRAGSDLGVDGFGNGHRLARHHGLVDVALPLDELAVDRDLFAGPHAQQIADLNGLNLHCFIRSAKTYFHGRLWC